MQLQKKPEQYSDEYIRDAQVNTILKHLTNIENECFQVSRESNLEIIRLIWITFYHPDYTVGSGVPPDHALFSACGLDHSLSAAFTAGREL